MKTNDHLTYIPKTHVDISYIHHLSTQWKHRNEKEQHVRDIYNNQQHHIQSLIWEIRYKYVMMTKTWSVWRFDGVFFFDNICSDLMFGWVERASVMGEDAILCWNEMLGHKFFLIPYISMWSWTGLYCIRQSPFGLDVDLGYMLIRFWIMGWMVNQELDPL